MKIKLIILCLSITMFIDVRAQTKIVTKKDTLYYLVDTAKTLKSDRLISIEHLPRNILYSVACPCIPSNGDFAFFYSTIKGLPDTSLKEDTYVSKKKLKKMSFTPLWKLIQIVCKEQLDTRNKHEIYFVEHLTNGKYVIRKVSLRKPFYSEE